MKKIFLAFLPLLLVFNISVKSQNRLLTVEDASWRNYSLFPAYVQNLQWLGNSDSYVYVKHDTVFRYDAGKGKEAPLFTFETLKNAFLKAKGDTLKRLPALTFNKSNSARFSVKHRYYRYYFDEKKVKELAVLPDSAENTDAGNDADYIAYTIKNNLYVNLSGKEKQITLDENPGIVNGQIVSRNEFGINKGIFWFHDGSKLAFYKKDETGVSDYPLVDIDKRVAEVKKIKYPMNGMTSEIVHVGVYDVTKDQVIYLKTGNTDHYLTSVTWGPAGKYIYLAVLNRGQNHMQLNKYDAATGELVKTLFEESNPKYVEPEHPLYFNPFNPEEFIWISERDGYDHLYLYDTEGNLIRQVTKGKWVVTRFLGFYRKHRVYFLATKESPLQQNLYGADINNGKISRITLDHGTHSPLVSKSGKYVIDIFSSTDVSREYKLLNYKGKELKVIKADKHPLKEYKLGKMDIFTIKSDIDGADLYCRMIKPVDFDSTKKYPVIVYVYGGPHAQLVTDSWLGGAGLFLNYLAENGYLIFTLDNHGSANRGRDFEQIIHRHLGTNEIKDQLTGVRYLKSLPYVDSTRIGVHGWSFGGFMTTSLMLRTPGVFKVGVGGGPVIDWKYYEVMYGERYMDTEKENPEGFKESSLLNYVQNLKGHLLLIHGTMDPTVVWQHSLLLVQKAVELNKLMDYFVYPGQEHGVRGKARVHLNRKIKAYFDDYL